MALSWNEIKSRAIQFSKEWENETSEDAEAKSFWDDFFNVFGISRRRVATFETKVTKGDRKGGFIDLLWKGNLLVEHKSAGKDLDRAYKQAIEYFPGLKEYELPKYILVCNFQTFRLYDLEDENKVEFKISEFVNNVQHFSFIAGYQKHTYKEQDPVNIKAAELMGKLHDNLKEIGYEGHSLEVYLVRILFCLFADDTTIFNKQLFQDYVEQRTNEDGSDLAAKIHELFQVLNTPVDKRFKNLDEQLAEFPYINGKLFEESLPIASFDSNMRQALLNSCSINWAKISPAIFGSMFQSVLNPKQRRNLGAHYTSEKNILKLIKPLFLDDLWKEFESIKGNLNKLPEFHKKLSMLKFLDPACGCGNFLVITYRELRLLELEILRTLYKSGQRFIDVSRIIWLDVDQFFGIEYEEFPSRIAEVAMWLIDHQMNILISNEFGQYFVRLPLSKAAQIHHDDALEVDWHSIVPNSELSYIIGNPPFSGSKIMKQSQRDQIGKLFENADGSGVLDYVTGWYLKAAKYIMGTRIKAAFVSTNSIVQGEQTSVLWGQLLNKYHIKIHFAHRTFKWSNEAKGNAAVYCIIVGFANYDATSKIIFEYVDIKGEPHELKAKNINPYLVDAKDLIIQRRSIPLGPINKLVNGSVPADGGNLILTKEDKDFIEKKDPSSRIWIRDYLGGEGFLNGEKRYCLWLKNCTPDQLKAMPEVMKRVNQVREMRIKSTKFATQKKGEIPSLFTEDRQPLEGFYIAIPRTSSENRKYIPIGYLDSSVIASNDLQIVPKGTLYEFGILTSIIHMSWVKYTCGRLESRLRYSALYTYNTFPWPENPSEKQKKTIEAAAQRVLNARLVYPNSTLASLYDPLTMPPSLVKAHNELDKTVDLVYRPQPFTSEAKRMEFLFELYEKYTSGLFAEEKKKRSLSN